MHDTIHSSYYDIMQTLRESAKLLILPPLSVVKTLFSIKQREEHTKLNQFDSKMQAQVNIATHAFTRLCLRHQPERMQRFTDIQQVVRHAEGAITHDNA